MFAISLTRIQTKLRKLSMYTRSYLGMVLLRRVSLRIYALLF